MGDPQIGNVFYWGGSPTEVTVLSPASGASAEGLILRGGARRALGFEGQESLRAGAPQDWRNGCSWRTHTSFHMHWEPAQSSDSRVAWARLSVGRGGSPGEAVVTCSSHWEQAY